MQPVIITDKAATKNNDAFIIIEILLFLTDALLRTSLCIRPAGEYPPDWRRICRIIQYSTRVL
jgi:hypothetical protein